MFTSNFQNRLVSMLQTHTFSKTMAFITVIIHRSPVDSPHKRPVTRKMFPFDDVIVCMVIWMHGERLTPMYWCYLCVVISQIISLAPRQAKEHLGKHRSSVSLAFSDRNLIVLHKWLEMWIAFSCPTVFMDLTNLPWTKWLRFRRRYFQMHFCEQKILYFD